MECILCDRQLCRRRKRKSAFYIFLKLTEQVIFHFVILVYSGFRSGVSIRYYHQRDIQALAGVHSTPLPSVKKAKKKKKSLLFIYIFMKLIKLIECFKILLSGLQVIIFRKHLNKITYWQLCDKKKKKFR